MPSTSAVRFTDYGFVFGHAPTGESVGYFHSSATRTPCNRFPDDFMFQLTSEEKAEVVANCAHLRRLKFSPNLPYAFTEHGAIMAANVLNSERAVEASVEIVRAFVRLRQILASNRELSRRLNDLERKYDRQFKVVFDAIRQLMTPIPSEPKRKQIGFRARSLKR